MDVRSCRPRRSSRGAAVSRGTDHLSAGADMSSDRREFIQRLTLGGIALGTLPTMLDAAPAPSMNTVSGAALLRGLQDQAMDVTWPKRLTGKHKAVFDSPDI